MQHCSGVAAATADKVEGILEEGIIDKDIFDIKDIEEVYYGETGFLDGSSSTQETKNYVGLVAVSKSSRS